MRTKFIITSLLIIGCLVASAQQRPFISGIDKISANSGEVVTISGQNLGGSIQVNFGAGRATSITPVSSNQVKVVVPNTATDGLVTVTNLTTGLSGVASQKFYLSYGGASLASTDFNSSFELETNQSFSWGLCSCDLDLDGDLDVVSTNRGATGFNVFLNSSNQTTLSFSSSIVNTGIFTRNITCGDINGDGKPDLVLGANEGTALNHIFIIQNTNTSPGTSTFDLTAFNNAVKFRIPNDGSGNGRSPQQVKLADMDGDGKKDLLVGNATDNIIFIYLNTSSLTTISFATTPYSITVPGMTVTGDLDVGDMTNNGLLDIVTVGGDAGKNNPVSIIQNTSSPGSLSFATPKNIGSSGDWISALVIDLDGDGLLDIASARPGAVGTGNGAVISTFQNTSANNQLSFGVANNFAASGAYILSSGDMDGDGKPDLIASSLYDKIFIFENTGSTVLGVPITISIPRTDSPNFTKAEIVRYLQAADFNADGKHDIAYMTRSSQGEAGQFAVLKNTNCLSPVISPSGLTFCLNSPFEIQAPSGMGLTYAWSSTTGNVDFPSGTTTQKVSANVTSGSSATITVTITSSGGSCTDVASQDFNITGGSAPTAPIITNSIVGTICYGDNFSLSTSNSADTWEWTKPDGSSVTTSTLAVTSASSADAGTYTLQIKSGSGCYSEKGTINVTVDQPPSISVVNMGNDDFCVGGNTTLQVANFTGFTYKWYNGTSPIAGQTTSTLNVTTSGDYAAEIISTNNCAFRSAVYTVNAVSEPVSDFNSGAEVCIDADLDFEAVSTGQTGFTLNYTWDFGDGSSATGTNVSHAYTTSGSYTVELTTAYTDVSACSDVVTKTITVSDIPTVSITSASATFEKCPSDSIRLELPQNYQSFLWSTGDTGYFTYAKTTRGQNDVTISVEAITDLGCPITTETTVSNFANSGFEVISSTGAFESDTLHLTESLSSITLSVTGSNDFNWGPDNVVKNPTGTSNTVYPNQKFTVVTLTGTDVNDCQETINLVIESPGLLPKKTFSPNGDGFGSECWEIINSDQVEGCTLYIMDTRSRIIYQGTSPFVDNCAWDGKIKGGGNSPEGIYYFILKCDNKNLDLTGTILLGR